MSEGDGNGPSLLSLAARGDRDALVLLRDQLVAEATAEVGPFRSADLMAQAEVLARLAASLGNPADKTYLAVFSFTRSAQARNEGNEALADLFEADGCDLANEVLALNDPVLTSGIAFALSRLADEGDEWAAMALTTLIDSLAPEAVAAITAKARSLDQKMEA